MYQQLHSKGFEIVAINAMDGKGVVNSFYKQGGFTFPSLVGPSGSEVATTYHVESYPMSYLIDSNGKIAARFDGFNEAGLRAALKKLGIE